ncbi:MAG: MiaB/RimO family radical SAM methylthiotransferase [Eggerthellaceae bacterium]|nr:MiaB/RimO family radical SAM methylthiotransferase [Eggerthellaceae bacterium]
MRFCVVNLGCKVNRVEADGFERLLREAGGEDAPEEAADLVVVNTCTVTAEADKKTRKAVRHALRANGRARVVVTGCAAAIDAAAFSAMDARVEVVPKAEMALWLRDEAHAIGACDKGTGRLSHCESPCVPLNFAHVTNDLSPCHVRHIRTRVGVKVQDGCDNACTYCIVHVARGRATSRPLSEVRAEVRSLAQAGVREIVLSGINLGSYRWEGAGLAQLLQVLLDDTAQIHAEGEPPCRFRVSSIEPADVQPDFIDLLAGANGRVCRHLHLPLQAGSTRVLTEMARPYTASGYAALVERLYAQVPELSLTTDVIVGFPGETDADFQETLALARRCRFSKIHVFPYSRREGTPAAARADQVAPEVKSARAAELRRLSAELREADLAARAGARELALVEENGRAMTESYHEIDPPADAAPGTLVEVCL